MFNPDICTRFLKVMFQNVEIPFKQFGNRQVLTVLQAAEYHYIREFIKCFPRCFEFDPRWQIWIFYPEGDAPCSEPTP